MKPTEDDLVLKFLHTADWHLGRRFRAFDEASGLTLSRARLSVLERVFAEAERSQVHAVLCAGDLFDDATPSREWVDGVVALFHARAWVNRPVFLLPGNHDPLVPESIWRDASFRKQLPAWVHVVDQELKEYPLANGAVLYAVPCLSRAGQADPTLRIPRREPNDQRVRIGLVHGSTFDLPEALTNFPISKDAAVERGLDYLAIGDTHGFRFIPPDRLQPPTIYPGAPEPTAFDEVDPGSVALVFINRQRKALVQRHRVASWTWEEVTIRSLNELKALTARTDLGNRVLRVVVDVTLTAPELEEAERLLELLAGSTAKNGLAGVLDLKRQRFELDVSTLDSLGQQLPAVLQATVKRLRLAADDPQTRAAAHRAILHLFRTAKKKAS